MTDSLPMIANCEGCGACCMHMTSPPFGVYWIDGKPTLMGEDDYSQYEFALISAAPQEARDLMGRALDIEDDREIPCTWFDLETKKCRFHQFRPGVCRDFEVGGESCVATRKARGIVAS